MVASNFTPSPDMVFGESNIVAIVVYSVMFVLGLTTNSLSLYQLVVARFKMKDNRISGIGDLDLFREGRNLQTEEENVEVEEI